MREAGGVKREEIFARDAYQCVYCGLVHPPEALSVDHVQPRVLGGDRSGGNLVTACGPCNVRKGHRTVAAFLADEPAALLNFRRLARHVWARHMRAVEEELRQRARGVVRKPRVKVR
jgi:5-methylcytosine-specific restriction endonuclease McrA